MQHFCSAPWDGTKGNITTNTIGDRAHTVVQITDIDQTVTLFSVTVTYSNTCTTLNCTPLTQMSSQFVVRIVDKLNPEPVLAVFNIPMAEVNSVFVSEFRPGQSEMFR